MRPHTKMIVLMCTLIFGILFLREEDCSTTLAKLNDDYDKREKAILEKGVKTLNSYLKDLPDESNEGKRGEPKHEEPKHEDPKHEEPKHEEPKHEEPKHEEPKHEEPKHEEPKHEEPKHEEPKHEEPKHEEQVESSIPGVTLAAEKKFDADMRQKWKASAGLYKDKSRHRELENVVMVTMVNNAYEKMFNNWKCQADKFGLDFLVLAFDSKAISFMGDDKTVVLPGSDTEEQIRVNTNRFNVMGCQKVDAVIKLLEIGADVIVIDADCVFKKEPVKFFKEAMQHDFYFQSNHPDCRTLDSANPDPACFLINSGFYYVTGKNKAMIELLKKARKSCYEHADVKNVSPTDGAGDQRALQRMLNNELNIPTHYYGAWDSHLKTVPAPWRQAYALNTSSLFKSASFCTHEHDQRLPKPVFHYCTLDPTIYPAGKHKGIVHDEMVAFHANHLPGGIEAKIRQLTKHRLWNGGEKCE